jgi:hypothetical protein
MKADEIQTLLRYHCATIVGIIDDGGIKPSQIPALSTTAGRIAELVNDLCDYPIEEYGPTVTERGPTKRFKP